MRALLSVPALATLAIACATSAPQPGPAQGYPMAPQCADGPPICSADRASVVQCRSGQWVLLQPCPGAQGCNVAGGAIQCDANPRSAAAEVCAAEGGYGCTADRRALTICRAGRVVIASTCRGARGCVVGGAVDCDHSVAQLGDPCEGPKEIACSLDGKQLLRCTNGAYQASEPCRNACLSTGGRVLCQ
jgi:hypothetical protein